MLSSRLAARRAPALSRRALACPPRAPPRAPRPAARCFSSMKAPLSSMKARPPLTSIKPRRFSSIKPGPTAEVASWNVPSRKNLVYYGGVAVAVGSVYYVSKTILNTVSSILNIKPKTMAMYGFYAGFVTATGVAIVLVGGVVAITMRPEPVYRAALKRIQNSPFVEMQMGRVAPGPLRAYTLEHGHLAGEGTTVIWRPPRVQLIFSLVGEKYDGVCSLECVKRGWLGTYDFTYIGVDVGNEQAERLLVEGDETQMVEQQDHLRGLVTFQKDRLQR